MILTGDDFHLLLRRSLQITYPSLGLESLSYATDVDARRFTSSLRNEGFPVDRRDLRCDPVGRRRIAEPTRRFSWCPDVDVCELWGDGWTGEVEPMVLLRNPADCPPILRIPRGQDGMFEVTADDTDNVRFDLHGWNSTTRRWVMASDRKCIPRLSTLL